MPFLFRECYVKTAQNEHFPDEQVTLQTLSYALFTISRGHSPSVMAAHKTVTSCEQAQYTTWWEGVGGTPCLSSIVIAQVNVYKLLLLGGRSAGRIMGRSGSIRGR